MPLAPMTIPPWVHQTGCDVATPARNFKYLGISTSCPVSERSISEEEDIMVEIQELESWTQEQQWGEITLLEAEGWCWRDGSEGFKWNKDIGLWVKKISKRQVFSEVLDDRWNLQREEGSWKTRWRLLWAMKVSYRKKMWLWKVLQRGFFTGSRAAEMRVSDGFCDRCQGQVESLEHIFWQCRVLSIRMEELRRLGAIPEEAHSLINWIDISLVRARRDTSSVSVLTNWTYTLWREKNDQIFQGKVRAAPTGRILQNAYREVDAYPAYNASEATFAIYRTTKETIAGWVLTWTAARIGRQAEQQIGGSPNMRQDCELTSVEGDSTATTNATHETIPSLGSSTATSSTSTRTTTSSVGPQGSTSYGGSEGSVAA
ncbi:hypothetical protein R1sor_022449 [Riccia sorocarpa]|uniref:Reverse transcriptase zinc-binding domain-containing protein n=1 Tax=Riccia sorocarpa TaxID=122646 RepID=A0ABD3GKL0_9MARC